MWSLLYITYIIYWMYLKDNFLFILVTGGCKCLIPNIWSEKFLITSYEVHKKINSETKVNTY